MPFLYLSIYRYALINQRAMMKIKGKMLGNKKIVTKINNFLEWKKKPISVINIAEKFWTWAEKKLGERVGSVAMLCNQAKTGKK